MANVRSKAQIARDLNRARMLEHRRCQDALFGAAARSSRREERPTKGDVKRCTHGLIMEYVGGSGYFVSTKVIDPFRHPIRYRRAVRAILKEERDVQRDATA